MTKIPPGRLFRQKVDIETGNLILSMIKDVRDGIDCRLLANFPRMMALAIEYQDFMHGEVLEMNFEMIVDCMYRYVKGV